MIKRFISHIRSVVFRHKYRRELMLDNIFWTLESKKMTYLSIFLVEPKSGARIKE